VNVVTPYIPRFVIENVAPESSGGLILPSRTFSASPRDSAAIWPRPLRSASKIVGTMSVPSPATATPMLIRLWSS
jgi:hypothetical protein